MNEFKLIVAGGREYNNYDKVSTEITKLADGIYADFGVSIVTGMARGADMMGFRFAMNHGIQVYRFPADWDRFGKSAGFRRNAEMADFADGLLAFWNGSSRGTDHMIQTMQRLNKPVHIVRY